MNVIGILVQRRLFNSNHPKVRAIQTWECSICVESIVHHLERGEKLVVGSDLDNKD